MGYTCTWNSDHIILQWRHNGRDGVSNHRRLDCLLNCLFGSRFKKTSKLRVTGLGRGIQRWPTNSPHKGPVSRKCFHLMTSSWEKHWGVIGIRTLVPCWSVAPGDNGSNPAVAVNIWRIRTSRPTTEETASTLWKKKKNNKKHFLCLLCLNGATTARCCNEEGSNDNTIGYENITYHL